MFQKGIIKYKKDIIYLYLKSWKLQYSLRPFEPKHDKISKMICAPSEDSDQTGHPSSLTRVFAVRSDSG